LSFWLAKQTFDNAEPFPVEWFSANGFARSAIPIGGVALIAFLAMQVGVYPRSLDAFVLLCGFVRPRPIAFGIPPQPGKGVRESAWRLARSERLAKIVQGHGAIFSKHADTNDDVLLYANVASPFEAVDKDCRNTNILSRCFATQSRLQSENPSSSSRWLSRGFAQRYNRMAQGGQMADIKRISVQQAYAKTKANQALLVCAYEDEAKCRMLNLDGSISFASLQSRAASLPKAQEIIFY
jgi:hypothetical protein